MAAALKIKVAIACFAIFILILIPLLKNNFYATVTIKRWSPLVWDDFKGIPPPFSVYEAGISSTVYLEYDSALRRYASYAGQNNVRSWAKRSREEQDYELRHEQYHFNITELHARELNDYITENPEMTRQTYLLRLSKSRSDLSVMQWSYDYETRHSLNFDKQARWEYQIDSQMTRTQGWVTDYFSGASIFFPYSAVLTRGVEARGRGYRCYSLRKYAMQFAMFSYMADEFESAGFPGRVEAQEEKVGRKIFSIRIDSTKELYKVTTISEDTVGYIYHNAWIYHGPYMYYLYSWYPRSGDTTGYAQNAQSFLNSFQIVDTNDYWIAKSQGSDSTVVFAKRSDYDKKTANEGDCVVFNHSHGQIFYRAPFYRDDGAMLMPYDCLTHPDSVRFEDALLINDDWYLHQPDPANQLYFVPANKVPQKRTTIAFGYTLLEDSAQGCYQYYHEALNLDPIGRKSELVAH